MLKEKETVIKVSISVQCSDTNMLFRIKECPYSYNRNKFPFKLARIY